jgi:hypothetical protein
VNLDLILAVAAGVLGGIAVFQSRGLSLPGWGVLLLALAFLPL